MKIELKLSYSEAEALASIVNNSTRAIKAEEIALSQLTVFQIGLPENLRDPIVLTLNEVQSRLYKNKSNDYSFLYKWNHKVIQD
jgi:hypothetical protein